MPNNETPVRSITQNSATVFGETAAQRPFHQAYCERDEDFL